MEQRLSLQEVARYPRPGMSVPHRITYTPDGAAVAYLFSAEGTLAQELWLYDLATGQRRRVAVERATPTQGERSLEEELRRERGRVREVGITDYQFARTGADGPLVLLVPLDGALYVAHGDGPLARLEGSEGALDARLSPDGRRIAFVRDDELHVMPARGGAPRRLTGGAGDGVTNGLAEYIAQEEMGRKEGYWWSPDSARLAFVRADSRHIPLYPIVHQGRESLAVEEHRYPFAGARNALVRLGVVSADASDADEDNVAWRPDGTLTAQIESRDQRLLRLVAFDVASGAATTLIEERGDPWINLSDDVRFLASGEILWSSEHSGFRHLYLYDHAGRELRTLTAGEWMVTGLAAVDEERRVAYFHGTRDGVLERRLYAVSLDGGEVRCLTAEAGWHEAVVSPDFGSFVDSWSSVERAPSVTVRRLEDGAETAPLFVQPRVTPAALGLLVPELTSFQNRDGVELFAAVYATAETRAGGERRPLVVAVYGGPHAQTVTNQWAGSVDLRAQYLAQQGFVVLKVDNRGSANRGLAFEAALARDMGQVEVRDQVDGVRWLARRPYVDGARAGIYGWSYGGYMTCRALLLAPEVFNAGVAGAPVSDWHGYDTHYTERYMGHPADNAAGYQRSAVLSRVEALRGKLLLVHGLVDENVHFRHTARLIAALTAAGKPYDLALFPEERHMPRDAAGLEYQERLLTEYLRQNL